ncbi:MAG: hypothetical protein EAY81_05805 [Bacteroidetes bacterium]|nr:MAG: hypothetical protein EAY81_05805 [Bacteroidota bacterium]
MENTSKNLFETFAETQKQVMENMSNATQQMAKSFMNTEMNSDFFKKWYDSQMAFFNQNNTTEGNPANLFNNWMNSQMNMGNDYVNNMQSNMKNMMGNMGVNPDMMTSYNNWMNTMNTTMQNMMKNMNGSSDAKSAMTGMFNNAEMMMKMYELWMPMVKMVNDKTYTPEAFKNMFNPSLFKEMMDKALNMQPDFAKNIMDMNHIRGMFTNMMDMGKGNADQMRNMFANMNPMNAGSFNNMNEQYSKMWNMMNEAAAPMMKMMGNSAMSNNMNMANEMMNEFNLFMMKNTQVQYATYNSGIEAMNEFAENVYTKMKNGEDMSNFMNVYSEWLNTNDKHLTQLFATPEYSKMQAELNTFGMKLKQNMNAQMEKAMQNVPVVPRSEMDELYKTVYELRKRVNMLEKQLDAETEETVEVKAPAAKKAAKNA